MKFSSRSELENALSLNGEAWPNSERWIKIVEAMDRKATTVKSSVGPKVRPEGCDTVFVGNIAEDVTDEIIRAALGSAGEISKIRLPMNEHGKAKGFCHVTYSDGSCTDAAMKLAGSELCGLSIRIDYAPPRQKEKQEFEGRGRSGEKDTKKARGKGGRGLRTEKKGYR